MVKLRERICGAAVGEFRAGEAVALWSVSGVERAAEGALIGNCHPRAKMGRLAALGSFFVIPQSTRWQAAEAARFAFSRLWCLGGLMWNLAHFVRTSGRISSRKNSPHGRKMTPPDLPHLLHSVSPVHILSYSR